MKSKTLKMLKTVTVLVVAFAIVATGALSTTFGASAADTVTESPEKNGVVYVQYGSLDPAEYWGVKAPEYTGVNANNGVGYLFGGWYTKDGDTYTPVEDASGLVGTIVAKFVPAQTMSVKCQNWAGTDVNSDDVIVRVISATDNINYKQFGFTVSKIVDGVEGKLSTVTTDTVYKRFNYYDSEVDTTPDIYEPSELFGPAANRFTTCTVGKIPTEHHGTIICIKPFWVTLDGVTVNGLSKFAHVEDGYLGYVNVPVNLNILTANNGAAAGRLNVTAPAGSGLTFIGAEEGIEYGKIFNEMEFNVLSDGTIRCVGNTSDLSDKTEMDVYVNLKFQRTQTNDAPEKGVFYTFSVTGEDFCDAYENTFTDEEDNVWNVIY